MSLVGMFNHTMRVDRLVTSRDVVGGAINAYTPVVDSAKCRVEDASSDLAERFASQGIVVTHRIFTQESDIKNGDRIAHDGLLYLVHGIEMRRKLGSLGPFYVLSAEELKAEL